jgi:hypothetical protein
MKKRMERLGDRLFQPLTDAEQRRVTGQAPPHTNCEVTVCETCDPAPDTVRDGDGEVA